MFRVARLLARAGAGHQPSHRPHGRHHSSPGRALLKVAPRALRRMSRELDAGSVLVSATNGKTTTAAMIAAALDAPGRPVVRNRAGSNMAWGVATALLDARRERGQIGLFEVDEASLPTACAAARAARRRVGQPVPRPARPLRRGRGGGCPLARAAADAAGGTRARAERRRPAVAGLGEGRETSPTSAWTTTAARPRLPRPRHATPAAASVAQRLRLRRPSTSATRTLALSRLQPCAPRASGRRPQRRRSATAGPSASDLSSGPRPASTGRARPRRTLQRLQRPRRRGCRPGAGAAGMRAPSDEALADFGGAFGRQETSMSTAAASSSSSARTRPAQPGARDAHYSTRAQAAL